MPTLALRIGFVGELGYELHFPSPAGEHLWDRLVAEGARPFGLEPQRVLRLEKGHVIVGQDTDSESNLFSAGMPWLPKMDKDDFVGKFALEHFARARREGAARRLHDGGGRRACRGRADRDRRVPAGRVTSARRSEAVGDVIGLAWVPPERAESRDARRDPRRPPPRSARASRTARSTTPPGSGCGREPSHFLSPSRCAEETLASPLAARSRAPTRRAVRDLSLDGSVEIRGDLAAGRAWRRTRSSCRFSPRRGLLLVDDDPAEVVERLRAAGVLAYDVTGALAGIAIESERCCAG